MGKYSSDSDCNEKRGSKSSYKSRNKRRSSSTDSDSSPRNKRRRDRNAETRRSKTGERYSQSRRSPSSGDSIYRSHKSKSYRISRSRSSEHLKYNRHSRSKDHNHRRSRSKERQSSRRSRSRSYIKEYVSKPKRHSSSSSSSGSGSSSSSSSASSTSNSSSSRSINKNDKKTKSHDNGGHFIKRRPDSVAKSATMPGEGVLNDINDDRFVQKSFRSASGNKKVLENIVIDLKKQTIKVPEVEPLEPDSIYHHNLFLNEEARMEKWVKELFSFRQKALQQGLRNNH